MKQMIIIDGNSLLFRAYYATAYNGPELMHTKDGIPTNAIFSFSNMMGKIIDEMPDDAHILVAFDTNKNTLRKQEMESYKANRKPAPEELVTQFPIARSLLKALNIFTFELDGFEGDDIAGTAAKKAEQEGYEVLIYTSDRDFLQLVDEHITVRILKKGLSETIDMTPKKVQEVYGFPPDAIRDFKGLSGDSSDNIPGVPGIGEKTATKLLVEYGSLEKAIEAAPNMHNKVGEKLIAYKDDGLFYKRMATIMTDVPLPFSIEETKFSGYDLNVVLPFTQRYELNQLQNRISKNQKHVNVKKASTTTIEIEKWNEKSLSHIKKDIGIGLVYEGKNYHQSTILGAYIYTADQHCFYLSSSDLKDTTVEKVLIDENIRKYVFDAKVSEVIMLDNQMPIKGIYFDLKLAMYLLDSSLSSSIKQIYAYFAFPLPTIVSEREDTEIILQTIGAFKLANTALEKVKNSQLDELFFQIELPLASVLSHMEVEGFPLDQATLKNIGERFKTQLNTLQEEIYVLAGHEFNIASPAQVGNVLFDELKLPSNRKKSTSVDQLKHLTDMHPIVSKILEFRKYAKLISTYIDSLVNYIFPDGKIHANFNQTETTTGRLSSSDPNMQNISIRDEEGKMIRQAFFYPDKEYQILSFDYSQIELRILASLSHCEKLINAFKEGIDIHTLTASHVFHHSPVSDNERRKAKAVNFGIVYGISDWGLAEQLSISPREANTIINDFYLAYPEIDQFLKSIISNAEKDGYVSTLFGRRRYLSELNDSAYQKREFAKRAAMNAPIQGTAADLIKIAMVKVQAMLESRHFETKMVLQIHDELIFKVPKKEKGIVDQAIREIMEQAIVLDAPLKVDGHYGHTWYDAK
ncbi:MAG: DNA polymerase I [Bacilli bacterium]|jgi:DNA polymerase-1|nr:DNA polymerase I [Bacilli bacterium]